MTLTKIGRWLSKSRLIEEYEKVTGLSFAVEFVYLCVLAVAVMVAVCILLKLPHCGHLNALCILLALSLPPFCVLFMAVEFLLWLFFRSARKLIYRYRVSLIRGESSSIRTAPADV